MKTLSGREMRAECVKGGSKDVLLKGVNVYVPAQRPEHPGPFAGQRVT